MSRVLIVDDHAAVRAGLKQYLLADTSVTAIGEAEASACALTQLRHHPWDLLLLDIHLPDESGLDLLRVVVSEFPDTRVLIVSGLPEGVYAPEVLRAGARGYIEKGASPVEMMSAVKTVLSGRRYVSAPLAELLVTRHGHARNGEAPSLSSLSQRETEVFTALASGKALTQIGKELLLSVKSVSTYRTRILAKMNISSNAEIVRYALRHGLRQ